MRFDSHIKYLNRRQDLLTEFCCSAGLTAVRAAGSNRQAQANSIEGRPWELPSQQHRAPSVSSDGTRNTGVVRRLEYQLKDSD
jgi:hypothetical protein